MRAIIPVAGIGSRLKPHTHSLPKVLLNVGGKPILGHIIEKILEEGITKATFITGYLGDLIQKYVKETYKDLDASFVEQKSLEGLGHAIYTAVPTFDDEDIFIILGDTIFDVDLKPIFSLKKSSIGVKHVDDPRRFGVAITENGKITKLVEKPAEPISHLAIVGLYYIKNAGLLQSCLDQLIKEDIRTKGEIQLTDALQLMIERGEEMTTFPVEGWYDCGKPETLLSTNKYLLDTQKYDTLHENVVINKPVFIAPDAKISNSVIGPYATISAGATINDSIIRNSIIGEEAIVERCLLEKSIIGNKAAIRGTTKKLNTGDSSEIEFY